MMCEGLVTRVQPRCVKGLRSVICFDEVKVTFILRLFVDWNHDSTKEGVGRGAGDGREVGMGSIR